MGRNVGEKNNLTRNVARKGCTLVARMIEVVDGRPV